MFWIKLSDNYEYKLEKLVDKSRNDTNDFLLGVLRNIVEIF